MYYYNSSLIFIHLISKSVAFIVLLSLNEVNPSLSCDKIPQPGSGTLSLKFTGELNDKMKGFYRSKYTLDGEDLYAAVTQFEVSFSFILHFLH